MACTKTDQSTSCSLEIVFLFVLGNGTQQFISIPVSMATGGNQQIQLLTTSNGQIVATNLANLAGLSNPLSANLANSGNIYNNQNFVRD